jgi:transposase
MKCKKTIDTRSYSHKVLEQLRISAVERVQEGESPEAVAVGLGINRRTIYRWLTAFHYGGDEALKAKAIPGAPPKLDAKQLAQLAKVIRDKNPQQLKFDYALWTLAIIRKVIATKFGVKLSESSVSRLMKRLGFSPQRPLYRAWQQKPELVQSWREQDYPKIVRQAKREGAVIFFGDEAGMRSDHHAGTTWAPVGETPVVEATGARFSVHMISSVNAQGGFRFMMVDGTVNASVFKEFLKRLITGMQRKVFLIVDGHPMDKAKLVREFVAANADRIELFFLPPYAPELNPDELAWAHIKTRVAKAVVHTKEQLKCSIESVMHRLQKLPDIVASFFCTPTCAYAK